MFLNWKVSVLVARSVNFARHLNSFQGMMKIHCHSWFVLLPFSWIRIKGITANLCTYNS